MKPYTPNTPGWDFHYISDKSNLVMEVGEFSLGNAVLYFPNGEDGDHTVHLLFDWEVSEIPKYYDFIPITIDAEENSFLRLRKSDSGDGYAFDGDRSIEGTGLYLNLSEGLEWLQDHVEPEAGLWVTLLKSGGTYCLWFRAVVSRVLNEEEKYDFGYAVLRDAFAGIGVPSLG